MTESRRANSGIEARVDMTLQPRPPKAWTAWHALFVAAALTGLCLTSLHSYLLFHSLVEVFSIAVGCAIFMLAWNARRLFDNAYLLFMGTAYLFVGSLDLLHVFAYKGMANFQGFGSDLPTQLWIASRYMESLSLLVAPFFIGRKPRTGAILLTYSLIVATLLVAIFSGVFPVCFVEGEGLTPFKRISEYVISAILAAAAFLLTRRRDELEPGVLTLIRASIIVTIGSEMAFTLYADPYDAMNMVGHCLKVVSFYLIYRAIIVIGLRRPYALLFRDLRESEEALKAEKEFTEAALNAQMDTFFVLELATGHALRWNDAFRKVSGYSDEEIRSLKAPDAYYSEDDLRKAATATQEVMETGTATVTLSLITRDGRAVPTEYTVSPIAGADGPARYLITIGRDITERKHAEQALREAHDGLERRVRERTTELARTVSELITEAEQRKQAEADLRIKDSAIASSISGIAITDMDGAVIYVNDSLVEMWGYESDREILGGNVTDFWEGEGILRTLDALHAVGTAAGEDTGKRKDGTLFPVAFAASIIHDDDGAPTHMFGSFMDITERKRAEEALRKSERALIASRDSFRRLAARLLTVQEEERRRLARELHDDLTQRLAVLAIDAGKL
ncbi:PAS domain S-box protein, partial [bacterium]|nr:PAS domain S-box protein [bacterium]